MNPNRRIFAVLAGCLPLCSVAFADLKVVNQMQISMNGDYRPAVISTVYFKGPWLRIDERNQTVLSNPSKHKTIILDHASKTYAVLDEDLTSGTSEMLKGMEPTVTIKVDPTLEQKTILSRPATKYMLDMDVKMKLPQTGDMPVDVTGKIETWAISGLNAGDVHLAMLATQDQLLGALIPPSELGEATRELDKIKGLPVSYKLNASLDTAAMPSGSVNVEMDMDVLAISEDTINQAMFEIPADYKLARYTGDDDEVSVSLD